MSFEGCVIHVISKGMGPKRYDLFKNQIETHGGSVCSKSNCKNVHTHVVCDEDLKPEDKEIKYYLSSGVKIVGTKWLSESIKMKKLANPENFLIIPCVIEGMYQSSRGNLTSVSEPEVKKLKLAHDETKEEKCRQESSLNSKLINELSKLANSYKSLGDVYRSRNYCSTLSVIQKYPKEIKSYDEALTINGITPNMASKIGEIIETGSLRKTAELTESEKLKTVELFSQIWGVGPATADSWFCQGYRTLDNIKTKCNLSKMQRVGLKYFDDFNKLMPRSEVETISSKVEEAAKSIDPSVKIEICGSYRRGKNMCGDIDVVIFENTEDDSNLLENLLKVLTSSGFVNDEFMSLEASKHHKFLGICKLPGEENIFRRLDIFIAPLKEYAPAMIHYTGSANFNIGLRQYAIKKGMHLSENGLFVNVVKHGSHFCTGSPLETPTEKSVFELLDLPYKIPEERETFVF